MSEHKLGWTDDEGRKRLDEQAREHCKHVNDLVDAVRDDPSVFDDLPDELKVKIADAARSVVEKTKRAIAVGKACKRIRQYLYDSGYADEPEAKTRLAAVAARHKVHSTVNNELRYTMLALQAVF